MTFRVPSRTGSTTSTSGTSTTIQLDAGIEGLFAFGNHSNSNENLTDGDKCPYAIRDGAAFEYGFGTFNTGTPDTLSRDVITASTNSGDRINLSGADAQVFVDIAGEDAISRDSNGRWTRNGSGLQTLEFGGTKTSAFTAEIFHVYLTDTTGGAFTVTLPASPEQDDTVMFQDIADNWGTDALTVDGNGSNIRFAGSAASTFNANINGRGFRVVYDGSEWLVVVGG